MCPPLPELGAVGKCVGKFSPVGVAVAELVLMDPTPAIIAPCIGQARLPPAFVQGGNRGRYRAADGIPISPGRMKYPSAFSR